MDDIFSFGKFIADKRKKLEITLREMAAELGIAPAYLSDIEKGRRYPPDMDRLMQIAKILKLTEDEKHTMFDLAGEGKIQYLLISRNILCHLKKSGWH